MKIEKTEKLAANLNNKTESYYSHKKLKASFEPYLVLKKVHRVMKFSQKSWLKPYIEMNTDLREAAKNDFEKDCFKLRNNSIFWKTFENIGTLSL